VKALTKRLVDFGKSDDVVHSVYGAPNTKNTAAKSKTATEKRSSRVVSLKVVKHTQIKQTKMIFFFTFLHFVYLRWKTPPRECLCSACCKTVPQTSRSESAQTREQRSLRCRQSTRRRTHSCCKRQRGVLRSFQTAACLVEPAARRTSEPGDRPAPLRCGLLRMSQAPPARILQGQTR
jgi:hypothetical protein